MRSEEEQIFRACASTRPRRAIFQMRPRGLFWIGARKSGVLSFLRPCLDRETRSLRTRDLRLFPYRSRPIARRFRFFLRVRSLYLYFDRNWYFDCPTFHPYPPPDFHPYPFGFSSEGSVLYPRVRTFIRTLSPPRRSPRIRAPHSARRRRSTSCRALDCAGTPRGYRRR